MHPIDIAILACYLGVVLLLGRRAASGARGEGAFFLADRKFGKLHQFFFNFGNTIDANTAVSTVSFVYREGASGAWLPLQMIFLNPYYWFMHVWFRRVRLMTTAELFETRLQSRRLASFYAVFQIGVTIIALGFSNFIAFKVIAALVPGLTPLEFYGGYAAVTGIYLASGGVVATVVNQVFQGLVLLFFSLMLLPAGWHALGSERLRDRISPGMFDLFGSGVAGAFTWYSVLAIISVTIVQINANVVNMGLGGSARNEFDARFGAVSGTFGKRIMIVLWAFLGLIAAALCQGPSRLSDPDLAWGVLSGRLLGPGFLGLMLAGVLAANMPSTATKTMAVSALAARNLFRRSPARPDDDGSGVLVGRVAIAATLLGSAAVALVMGQALTVMKLILSVNLPFGACILLMFFWRRLTRAAVWWSVVVTTIAVFIVPFAVQTVGPLRSAPALLAVNHVDTPQGTATVPRYFDRIAGEAPAPREGRGRFNLEVWVLERAGFSFAHAGAGALLAAQFFFDAVLPFAILFGVSLVTAPPETATVERFFGIMKTPVGPTPEADADALEETTRHPRRFDDRKLFPRSNWEFTKWEKTDAVGFFACCGVTVGILAAFWLALRLLR